MDYYRLEYSEQQGRFHFNSGSVSANTNGWQTLCDVLSYEQCCEFAELIIDKYPSTNPCNELQNTGIYPKFEVIQKEFVEFLLSSPHIH